MDKSSKIFIAGHRGMAGSAIMSLLQSQGYTNIVTRTRQQLNLLSQPDVEVFYQQEKPAVTILAAAKVGGIAANIADPLSFVRDNLILQSNVFASAHTNGCQQMLFLGSSCIYPRECPQPMKEEYYLTGIPEPTNQGYAIAKFAGLQLCMAHNAVLAKTGTGMQCRAIQPPNLYGTGDHFGEGSHALSGMMERMHNAKVNGDAEFTVWGTGNAMREWMHVADMASAAVHALTMEWPTGQGAPLFYNCGTGEELSMRALAEVLKETIDYQGKLVFDPSKPEGMPRKLMDSSKFLATGWKPAISLAEGLKNHYAYYLNQLAQPKAA